MSVAKNIEHYFLYPCQIFCSTNPVEVETILGSCISVCLFDRKLLYGGVNHFMLPLWNGDGLATPKYGNIAIEKLYDSMISLGCKKENLISKIFGGANQFSGGIINIGERNYQIAESMLLSYGIPVVAKSVFGTQGRKIIFHTGDGSVRMKLLKG